MSGLFRREGVGIGLLLADIDLVVVNWPKGTATLR